jgi:hypothetical protein
VIVYNLACSQQHLFEGWFASPADFENQRDRGLVECPACGATTVERKLHAARINTGAVQSAASHAQDARDAKRATDSESATLAAATAEPPSLATRASTELDLGELRQAMQAFAENVRENTEYVGEKFADEARAMHYGEKPHKGIRGRADKETAQELREEGITFQSLPFPVDFPNSH